jgi:hypothetical protein
MVASSNLEYSFFQRRSSMNVLDVLKYGHLTIENSLQDLSETDWEVSGVCGVWSIKDIIAHLTSYEYLLKDVFGMFLHNGETDTLREFQKGPNFNDEQVDQRKHLTFSDVLAEYNETQAVVMQLAAKIPAEKFSQNGTIPWYGEQYCLDDLIVYMNYAHKREHVAQINVYQDTR